MKDVVVVAGGNSERGLLLRDKLVTEQHCVKLCQSSKDFYAVINEEKILAILLLFPDELAIVSELLNGDAIYSLAGRVPLVFISTSPLENDRVRSSHYKADEFLIEPVSPGEIAKIIDDAIELRLQGEREHILTAGDITLNKETLVVTWQNKIIPLYPLQVYLLEFLILNPRRPITRTEILNNVWNTDIHIDYRTIDRNIKRIRDVFKRKAKRDPIRTVHRVGYLFNDQFEQLSSLS